MELVELEARTLQAEASESRVRQSTNALFAEFLRVYICMQTLVIQDVEIGLGGRSMYYHGSASDAEGLLQERFSFDAEYLRRLGDGDPEIQDHFARYFGELIRIKASARLRSTQAADDIRQETLMRVLKAARIGTIEHPERLGGYVNTVANNVISEIFRKDGRVSQLPEDASEISSGEEGAEAELAYAQRKELVQKALDKMPPKDRELLQRIYLHEEDKDAVCKAMGVSREYLRVLLHRARGGLRSAMKGRGQGA